jgi:hypothetical protein
VPSNPIAAPRRAWSAASENRAFVVALLSVLPLFVWWLGWFPGFLSSDSFDQLGQARSFEFFNAHPALHTFVIWMVTRVWDNPGAVTLLQLLAMSGLLALAARRLTRLGVPWGLAAGTAIFVSLLPAVGSTTIALWKDVPYTLAMLWAFTELLGLAGDRHAFWDRPWTLLRLGGALGLMWLFRHNGFLTVVPLLVVLLLWSKAGRRRLLITITMVGAIVLGANFVLFPLLDVNRSAIEPGTVFISDVAASLHHEPGNFSDGELAYLESMAPRLVWNGLYDCHDSTPLVFDPRFDTGPITDDPGRFQRLVAKTYLRDLDTVLGHRWCAADYLLWPPQPKYAYFQRPPFVMAPNEFGIEFDPISERAHSLTLDIVEWADKPQNLWLVWRPALAVWLAIAVYAGIAWRRRLRVLLLGGALLAAQTFNVAATTPAQEFRFAFGIYVVALLSVPLLWLVARPLDASLADPQGRALRFDDDAGAQRLPTTTNSLKRNQRPAGRGNGKE